MSKIDKKWLQQTIAEMEEHRDLFPGDLDDNHENVLSALRIALASLEAEPVAYIIQDADARSRGEKGILRYFANISDDDINEYKITVTPLYTAPPAPVSVPDDYFASLVAAARVRANKAMRKFPQPNYVLNKVAEESGEVIKAVIHFTEGREEWRNVEGEIIDNLAMLIRLVMEGDQVIGFTPPDACRAAMLQGDERVTTACKLRDAVETIRNSGIEIDAEKIFAERDALNAPDCWCRTCRPITLTDMRFVVCPECGNKRCPHANDHRNACTGSNEPGQKGSAYPAAPQQEVKP
ncbi:hypothetical protein [Enterobacter cloacae]|uniref:Phage protein n=1 Tax=Enterobacter cloacae TaxID=550 RepID=A0AAW6NSW8_ENTCL|nr:hypothetical protein [Enterobacter cloacae]MDF3570894.1 hypothetical protein [Enterobacter cloacae]MDF3638652.1 hypothetical protein [Enterobacter cloacae]